MALTFNDTYYLSNNADVLAAVGRGTFATASQHYSLFGARELRNPNSTFNAREYVLQNDDLVRAFQNGTLLNPFQHYLTFGVTENRAPNAALFGFDSARYLSTHADVAAAVGTGKAFSSAMQHYLLFGATEGRAAQKTDGTAITGISPGTSFSLTTGVDNVSGTTANDTISGVLDTGSATQNTISIADIISGGAGTDTLNLFVTAGDVGPTTVPTVNSVETVSLTLAINTPVVNSAVFPNITALAVSRAAGTAVGGADAATAARLTTVNALPTAVTSVTYSNVSVSEGDLTLNYKAGLTGTTDTLSLTLSGISRESASTTNDDFATIIVKGAAASDGFDVVSINSTGSSNRLDALKVTDSADASTMTTLNITGANNLQINSSIDFAGTTSGTINAQTLTGTLSLDASTGEAITFTGSATKANTITTGAANDKLTGGSADDTFTVGAGNDTVEGGAGNDRVVFTDVTAFTADDSISLGDGTRDVLAFGTITAVNDTNFPTATDNRITAAKAEVVEVTTANVTAVDYATVPVDIIKLSGGSQNVALTNVLTNDVLIVTSDILDANAATAGAVEVAGGSPGQTFRLELFGTGIDLKGKANNDALEVGLKISSNIAVVQIDSSATTADSTAPNTIVSQDAAAVAVNNVSAQSFILTGNQAFTLTGTGAAVGFAAGVSFDAVAFNANTTIELSNSNDVFVGGLKNDTVTPGNGDDSVTLTSGGNDTVIFGVHADNGKDTITGFTGGLNADRINVAALGDGSTGQLDSTISSAAAQQALTDDRAYIINTTGAAGNLTTGGTAAVTSFTDLTQIAAYLSERFSTAANNEAVFVVNQTGTTNTYVYSYVEAATNASIQAAELRLVGVITTTGALTSDNVIYS
ncbi:MAG: hypothetical protein SF002_09160 [Alphaproteobacteria bacterium]|nr:hypothetical protein [Alphaproteobacteria bacterium]